MPPAFTVSALSGLAIPPTRVLSVTHTTTECFTVTVISTVYHYGQLAAERHGYVTAGSATKLNGSLKFTLTPAATVPGRF